MNKKVERLDLLTWMAGKYQIRDVNAERSPQPPPSTDEPLDLVPNEELLRTCVRV